MAVAATIAAVFVLCFVRCTDDAFSVHVSIVDKESGGPLTDVFMVRTLISNWEIIPYPAHTGNPSWERVLSVTIERVSSGDLVTQPAHYGLIIPYYFGRVEYGKWYLESTVFRDDYRPDILYPPRGVEMERWRPSDLRSRMVALAFAQIYLQEDLPLIDKANPLRKGPLLILKKQVQDVLRYDGQRDEAAAVLYRIDEALSEIERAEATPR